MKIRPLREDDERSRFHSGDADLDRFLHRFAGQNQFKHHVGVTYVAAEGERILAFATIAPAHLEIERLPALSRAKLPRYPLPVLRLARLAVARSARGLGLGKQLLRYVFHMAVRMAADYGCVGVVVDAKSGAVAFYEKYGFIALHVVEGQSEARPRTVAMFLSVNAIAKAGTAKGE
jgi:GNAT superfamily N-acetyltransferase